MNREGRGFFKLEFDNLKKKPRLARHALTITSFTKEQSKTSEGGIEI